jgi:phosphoribosylformylglycinamidine (FGAM) synthase-like enzyme
MPGFSRLWAILDPYRWVVAGVAVMAVLGALWGFGHARYSAGFKAGQAKYEAAFKVAFAKAVKESMRREAAAGRISVRHRAALTKINTVTRTEFKTLREKVKVYVPAQADAGCTIPTGFVSLYNEAVSSGGKTKVPRPAGGPVGAPSGVQLSDHLVTDLDNLELGHLFRNEAATWRSWYQEQKRSWDGP